MFFPIMDPFRESISNKHFEIKYHIGVNLPRPAHKRKQIGLLAGLRKIISEYSRKWLTLFYDLDTLLQ